METYLKQYKPENTLFRWSEGSSFAIPFDKIMWKVRAAQQYSVNGKHGAAARLLRSALTEDFAHWKHRGVETARAAHEPNVYALYCKERGLAALETCKKAAASEIVARLASYAAVMLGTACRMRLDNEVHAMALEAAGTAYDKLGEHFLASNDRVGDAVGAFEQAQHFYNASELGSRCRLNWARERNNILHETVTTHPLPLPVCLGGCSKRRASDA